MSDAELTKKLEEYLKEYGHGYVTIMILNILIYLVKYIHIFLHYQTIEMCIRNLWIL